LAIMTDASLRAAISAELDSLKAIRHDLHVHPELAFREERTCRVVMRELEAAGVRVKGGLAKGTGVIGHLPASTPAGNALHARAFRADMDALPVTEATGLSYASGTPGLMHACGHDGHTTILIGLARVLAKRHRPRPVTFLFQPAEEDGGGAQYMCDDGCLAGEGHGGLGTPVAEVFGLHGWPTVEVGTVATKPGPLMAATDEFTITIKGTQSHGAYPHFGHDPIVAASHVVTAIQTIVSRNASPLDAVVATVGVIRAGTASNIIPAAADLVGTIRTLRPETRAMATRRLREIVTGVAAAMGCEAIVRLEEGYPVTHNDGALTADVLHTARAALGDARVREIEEPTMGGEDFAYYGRHAAACFLFLGLRPKGATDYPTLHQPNFDFNDEAIPTGIEVMASLALR
jgi:amidohydrolase